MTLRRHSCLFLGAAALAACASPTSDWSQATTRNSLAAYESFLAQHPSDVHAADARARIVQLRDEQAWNAAQIASTPEGYQQYLVAEPNGAHAQEAREQIVARGRASAWAALQDPGRKMTAATVQDFLRQYPTGPEADEARDRLKTLTGYRVELGSARTESTAERDRAALAKHLAKEVPQIVVQQPGDSSHDFIITSAPMSEADADSACANVKRAGHSCKVIPAAG